MCTPCRQSAGGRRGDESAVGGRALRTIRHRVCAEGAARDLKDARSMRTRPVNRQRLAGDVLTARDSDARSAEGLVKLWLVAEHSVGWCRARVGVSTKGVTSSVRGTHTRRESEREERVSSPELDAGVGVRHCIVAHDGCPNRQISAAP